MEHSTNQVSSSKLRSVVMQYMASPHFPSQTHPALQAIADSDVCAAQQNDGPPPDYHTANGTPALLFMVDEDDEVKVPLDDLYKDANKSMSDFRDAMIEYERQCPPDAKCRIDVKSKHTWDQLIGDTTDALKTYKKPGGMQQFMRKMRDILGNNKDTALAWADFLPSSSEYFSILCGGLKLIIRAAARITTITEELTSALERIPEMLNFTQGTLEIFRSSKELHGCSSRFYVALIKCLVVMVEYLKKKSIARFAGVLFKLEAYGKKIDDSIEHVQDCSELFKQCAQRCNYALNADTNRISRLHIRETRQARQENLQGLELVKTDSRLQGDRVVAETRIQGDRGVAEIDRIRQELTEQASLHRQEAAHSREQMQSILDSLSQLLASHSEIDPKTQNLRPPPLGVQRSPSASSARSKRSLEVRGEMLDALDYKDDVRDNDLASCLRISGSAGAQAQDKAQAIMRHRKMLDWVSKPSSSPLFVNGNHPQSYRQAPTSIVSAQLARSVGIAATPKQEIQAGHNYNIALSFFCGQHRNTRDPNSGPDGMMRNLIAQLLSIYPDFDLTNLGLLQKVDTEDVEDLCQILEDLIMQLTEHHMVFCILDNITTYELRDEWTPDAEFVLKHLVMLTKPENGVECTFKLLLTSAIKSTSLYHTLPREDVIFMPEKVPAMVKMSERAWKDMLMRKIPGNEEESKEPVAEVVVEAVATNTDSDSDSDSD